MAKRWLISQIQKDPAILAYLVKGRHLRTRGRQTLQMNGFLCMHMGNTHTSLSPNCKRKSKIQPDHFTSFDPFCVPI